MDKIVVKRVGPDLYQALGREWLDLGYGYLMPPVDPDRPVVIGTTHRGPTNVPRSWPPDPDRCVIVDEEGW